MNENCILPNNFTQFQNMKRNLPEATMNGRENCHLPDNSIQFQNVIEKLPKPSMNDNETCSLTNRPIQFQSMERKLPEANTNEREGSVLPDNSTHLQNVMDKLSKPNMDGNENCSLANSSIQFQSMKRKLPEANMKEKEGGVLPNNSIQFQNMMGKLPKPGMDEKETCILPNSSIQFQNLIRKLLNLNENRNLPSSSTQPPKKKRKSSSQQAVPQGSTYGNFKSYVLKVKKLLIPGMRFNDLVLQELDDFIAHVIDMFDTELTRLSRMNSGKTLTENQLEAAVRLCLPWNIGELASKFGRCAVRAYRNEFQAIGSVYKQEDIVFDGDAMTEGSASSSLMIEWDDVKIEEEEPFIDASETGSNRNSE